MGSSSEEKRHSFPKPLPNPQSDPICFSHPAEAAFARVLDFYRIEWAYEPTTFPLEWDEEGQIKVAFTPDFYLVDEDMYVELTTLKQSLVTKKNRKMRLLAELYPGVRCKLMYRKDIENMAIKYGLFEEGPMPRPCWHKDEQGVLREGEEGDAE